MKIGQIDRVGAGKAENPAREAQRIVQNQPARGAGKDHRSVLRTGNLNSRAHSNRGRGRRYFCCSMCDGLAFPAFAQIWRQILESRSLLMALVCELGR